MFPYKRLLQTAMIMLKSLLKSSYLGHCIQISKKLNLKTGRLLMWQALTQACTNSWMCLVVNMWANVKNALLFIQDLYLTTTSICYLCVTCPRTSIICKSHLIVKTRLAMSTSRSVFVLRLKRSDVYIITAGLPFALHKRMHNK